MSLLSFLGKVGKGIWKGVTYARPVAAAVGVAIPGPDPFESVANLIGTAETVGEIVRAQGGTRLDKFALILPVAEEAIRNSELLMHRELVDEALFTEGVTDVVNGEVKILKAFKDPS